MSPKLFLKTSPYPTGPRFPFVASSKLSLKKPLGGWFHLCRLKVELSLGEGWTFCEWGAIPQFCRIVVSNWLALKSSSVHEWKKRSFKYIIFAVGSYDVLQIGSILEDSLIMLFPDFSDYEPWNCFDMRLRMLFWKLFFGIVFYGLDNISMYSIRSSA